MGYPVREHNITGMGKKEVRAEPWAGQLAAMNVWLVDNGQSEGQGEADWDIDGYIHEHELFPLGKWKDRVDASSGGISRLSASEPGKGMRILPRGDRGPKEMRIIITDKQCLENTLIEEPALLISIQDHPAITSNGFQGEPKHCIATLLDTLVLTFSDLIPEEHQSTWDQPVEKYGVAADQLIMNRDHARKLWVFLNKKRDKTPLALVFQDDGDRRAMSMAQAVCNVLGRKPESTLLSLLHSDIKVGGEPPNRFVFDLVKLGRSLVM